MADLDDIYRALHEDVLVVVVVVVIGGLYPGGGGGGGGGDVGCPGLLGSVCDWVQ